MRLRTGCRIRHPRHMRTTNASAVPAIRPTIMRIISDTPLYLSTTPRSAFEYTFIFFSFFPSRLAFASQHNKSTS